MDKYSVLVIPCLELFYLDEHVHRQIPTHYIQQVDVKEGIPLRLFFFFCYTTSDKKEIEILQVQPSGTETKSLA